MTEDIPDELKPGPLTLHPTPAPAPALPPMFHNAHALPALLDAFALAQAEYTPVVRDKLVVQRLKNKNTGEYTGATIKFLYAELKSILDATRLPLSKHGLSFSQPITTEPDGLWVNSILAHKDGAMIITMMKVPVTDRDTMPEVGGKITYIRRYAAGPALGVSAEDDADENPEGADSGDGNGGSWEREPDQQPARAAPARKSAAAKSSASQITGRINEGQVKFLKGKLAALKLSDAEAQKFFERVGVNGFTEAITLVEFGNITKELDRMRDA